MNGQEIGIVINCNREREVQKQPHISGDSLQQLLYYIWFYLTLNLSPPQGHSAVPHIDLLSTCYDSGLEVV